ncbi:NTP transferase domain-containing protein [Bacillus manliponensis]|uniref:nucleotidyltransferase family protein n=1 Tax=Bacillus manliponensis TaxID=574376 RepID=UPI00138DE5A7|nr:nucleotidyltransferase family protein [Bacillus manliponensis]
MKDRIQQKFIALVLGAGKSSRMGQPKQLLKINQEILLQHVVRRILELDFYRVIVVLGHFKDEIESELSTEVLQKIHIVHNKDYEEGISTSIKIGIHSCTKDIPIFIFVGDQPIICPKTITRMKNHYHKIKFDVGRIFYNGTPAHPVLLGRKAISMIKLLQGDNGFSSLIKNKNLDTQDYHIDECVPLIDIDRPEDYLLYIKSIEGA